jgi:hypothetical protein
MSRPAYALASLLALPVAVAALGGGASNAVAGCHLVDCVENVYVKPHEVKKKSCEDLWILRNSMFKDARYCFKTPRAISWFGNQGCLYDDEASVPLNDYQRHNITVIEDVEASKGC